MTAISCNYPRGGRKKEFVKASRARVGVPLVQSFRAYTHTSSLPPLSPSTSLIFLFLLHSSSFLLLLLHFLVLLLPLLLPLLLVLLLVLLLRIHHVERPRAWIRLLFVNLFKLPEYQVACGTERFQPVLSAELSCYLSARNSVSGIFVASQPVKLVVRTQPPLLVRRVVSYLLSSTMIRASTVRIHSWVTVGNANAKV